MVKEEEDPEMSTGQVSIPLLPRTSTRGVLMIGGHTLPVGVITDGLGGGTFVCDPSDTSDNMKTIESLVSETLSNNTFSNSSCNQVPLSPSNLTTLGAKKTTDSPVSPPAITSAPTNTSTVPLIPANDQGLAVESLRPCDDISIDLRKLGGGPGRSVKLELRELLDLVMAAAQPHFNLPSLPPAGKIE
ncbi:unnamed protein product [Protopolystoma xenopodis]|uniref:Uncharacterized protein n=1 Tax=Protopolystoma xenopodis TaxID=117903 RepID=A0A448WRD5_9PLAT|nr:unnamed protein product [Protopolystoma xenopodis]